MIDIDEIQKAQQVMSSAKIEIENRLAELNDYYISNYPDACKKMLNWHEAQQTNSINLSIAWVPICNQFINEPFSKYLRSPCVEDLIVFNNTIDVQLSRIGYTFTSLKITPDLINASLDEAIAIINAEILKTYGIDINSINVYTQPQEPVVIGSIIKIDNDQFVSIGRRNGEITWVKIIIQTQKDFESSGYDKEDGTQFSWNQLCDRGQIEIVKQN